MSPSCLLLLLLIFSLKLTICEDILIIIAYSSSYYFFLPRFPFLWYYVRMFHLNNLVNPKLDLVRPLFFFINKFDRWEYNIILLNMNDWVMWQNHVHIMWSLTQLNWRKFVKEGSVYHKHNAQRSIVAVRNWNRKCRV